MNSARRFLVPSIIACALLAALALAATASAEIRVGEATAPVNPTLKPEANVIGAKAEYNSDTGAVTLKVTTAAAPWPGTDTEPSELAIAAGLGTPRVCTMAAFGNAAYPIFAFQYAYAEPGHGIWSIEEAAGETPAFPATAGEAMASISVTTTTLTAAAPRAVNRPYNCAIAYVRGGSGGVFGEPLIFPIAVPPPPADTGPTSAPTQVPTPTPPQVTPAALSIAKLKALKLKPGKWRTVRIKIFNRGGTATAPGSLRLKAPRGVLVKPEKQKLPVLNPGATWTVTAKAQLTPKAAKKSTVRVTAAAAHLGAKGSLVLKRQG